MKLRNFKPSFVPGIIWLIISTILFCLPASALPKETWLEKIWFDKWVHIGIFVVLVITWCWACMSKQYLPARLRLIFFCISLTALFYGAGMELVQHTLVPNREFDVGDIIADAVGCFAGFLYSTRRYIKK